MRRLKIGVIGLGEVAQVIHLPILACRPELFELAAVCDVQLRPALSGDHDLDHEAVWDKLPATHS